LKGIADEQKMREYILEHQEELATVPIALLNSICKVEGYRFHKQRGIVGLTRKADSRHNSCVALRKDVDKLIAAVTKMDSIVNAVVQLNQLRLPE
jgi:hypothetical protein